MKTNKITLTGLLTALYVVLSLSLKINLIGNITIDLGYVALAIACCLLGGWAGFVGAIGCSLESLLFSAYGFSISWFIANLIIGLGCGIIFKKTNNTVLRAIAIVLFTALGVFVAKTVIECKLYNIPFAVKIMKNAVAFIVDTIAMLIGLYITPYIKKAIN